MEKVRVYWNLHKHKWSVQSCKTGLVKDHKQHITLQDAKFVVRKGGQERVRKEGKKNVHAFVNGIRSKLKQGMMPEFASYKVRYDPYTMDYFHYRRIVNGNAEWLPVDRHWIGNVYLYISRGKPIIHADIDKLSSEKLSSSNQTEEPIMVIQDGNCTKKYYDGGGFAMDIDLEKSGYNEFLRKKRKQIENKKKLLAI